MHSKAKLKSSEKKYELMVLIWKKHTALGYRLDDQWFKSQQRLGIFLFTTTSRLALGPTQPPIQWVPGALSEGKAAGA
jgi:hypothetical protein